MLLVAMDGEGARDITGLGTGQRPQEGRAGVRVGAGWVAQGHCPCAGCTDLFQLFVIASLLYVQGCPVHS